MLTVIVMSNIYIVYALEIETTVVWEKFNGVNIHEKKIQG